MVAFSYGAVVSAVRSILLGLAIVVAAISLFDWAVRTRRISPFNRFARFFRARIDPLMEPVERVVVRAGGSPVHAPWWTLAAVIVGGILLISLLEMFGTVLAEVIHGVGNPGQIPLILASWTFSVLRLALLVRVLASWLPISPHSRWIRWSYPLTEWMLGPIRRLIPRFGMIDLSPLIAWLLLSLLQSALGIP